MNNDARKRFWDVLCAAREANDYQEFSSVIEYPRHIYRYRALSINSVSALQQNCVYFSTSDYYDDPFDTNLHIDKDAVRKAATDLTSGKIDQKNIDAYTNLFGLSVPRGVIGTPSEEVLSLFNHAFSSIQTSIKKDTWSVCFSESATNENLWLKYADSHKGFAVEYDTTRDDLMRCGKEGKCTGCPLSKSVLSLYPMYYSDDKYDATAFAQFYMLVALLREKNTAESINRANQVIEQYPFHWERERIALIKKYCHHYDQEWRIIRTGLNIEKPYTKWIPSSVILGLKMSAAEKALVAKTALNAGVEAIKEVYIDDGDCLGIRDLTQSFREARV